MPEKSASLKQLVTMQLVPNPLRQDPSGMPFRPNTQDAVRLWQQMNPKPP
ncbi:hypothetical protein [Pajaroellobacter abortibovis]|nr:hypothetical protein [Pajaroellobacter abortibovis]